MAKKKDSKNGSMFVFRDGMVADSSYVEWLSDIKQRFRQSQTKASIRVNTEMLEFYWGIGRDLVALRAEERWGTGVVKQFALDMRRSFPNETGFSFTNVKYMKQWYLFYFDRIKKGQRAVGQLEMPKIFGKVPWGQHIDIVSRCQLIDEAMFYVNNVVNNGWSRPALNANIDANLFQTKGTAVTNFDKTLPSSQEKIAKEILKDPYHFEFLKMQEKYEEGDLEDALIANVTQFLLELGIIDLKVVKYTPEFAGKLNFYVTAADELLRGEGDNPSVGLIICKSTDKTVVEWSLKDINKPLGVATYKLREVVDRTMAEMKMKKKRKLGVELEKCRMHD